MNRSELEMPLDVTRILGVLPHRYPFLLVDRVIAFESGKYLRAIKNVTFNEPFFQGHFPGHPVMPGVLVLEALAQAGGLLTQLSEPQCAPGEERLYYLVKIDNARFSRIVVPGDQLVLDVRHKRMIKLMGFYTCRALVGDEEVASADIVCAERKP